MEGDSAFSSIDIVGQCLVDTKRTEAFKKAIFAHVKKGDSVLDLGTGSGVLALFAAKAGAKKVSGVEFDPFVAGLARENCKANDFGSVVDIKISDARNVSYNEKFDVVLAEMLTTGIVDEYQVQSINNLYEKNLVTENTVFIPQKHETFVTLVTSKMEFFGIKMPMIVHLWRWHKNWRSLKIKNLSEPVLLNSLDFKSIVNENFESTIEISIKKSGKITGFLLTSLSTLAKNIIVGDTEALNAPVFIPLPERQVTKGEKIKLKVNYVFGGGYQSLNASFVN